MRRYLVTGAAGFIGSTFIEQLLVGSEARVVVLDAMTYAGHQANLDQATDHARHEGRLKRHYEFVQGSICDRSLLAALFERERFDVVVNFAAESHVDRSIEAAGVFVETNVLGVFNLLDASLRSWIDRTPEEKSEFRFIQVSTDEVFGQLGETGAFTELTPYAPSSPYSASKASGDHLARAWNHTFQLPVIVTNCSNNYGPRQFPEKLIPHMINCALSGRPLPVYGTGHNVRDWIHVSDHCRGIMLAIEKGLPGESYCFGGRSERRNLNVVEAICDELDRVRPRADGKSYREQITFVEDRKGHDWRYAIDDAKAERELGFKREFTSFEEGLKATVGWYLNNQEWMKTVMGRKA